MLISYPTSISLRSQNSGQNIVALTGYAAVGALCGRAFHLISPAGGALFNVSALAAQHAYKTVINQDKLHPIIYKIFQLAIPLIAAYGVILAFQYSIPFSAAINLQLVSFLPTFYLALLTQQVFDKRTAIEIP